MSKIKDKLWIWGHEAGSHNIGCGIKGASRMTPAEGAFYLGVPNLIMVRCMDKPAPPYEQYARALSSLKSVVWSIIGAAGGRSEKESDKENEVILIRDLASQFVNIRGVMMDDFFGSTDEEGNISASFTPLQLKSIREQLPGLDLWVVLYDHQLNLPVDEHLKQCDVINFWTWEAKNLKNLEQNFNRLEKQFPFCRQVLGCYMYDYSDSKPMPVSLMEKQCQMGLQWLKEGRIEGMVFLASCICDLGLEAVEWTRKWIQEVGDESLNGSYLP